MVSLDTRHCWMLIGMGAGIGDMSCPFIQIPFSYTTHIIDMVMFIKSARVCLPSFICLCIYQEHFWLKMKFSLVDLLYIKVYKSVFIFQIRYSPHQKIWWVSAIMMICACCKMKAQHFFQHQSTVLVSVYVHWLKRIQFKRNMVVCVCEYQIRDCAWTHCQCLYVLTMIESSSHCTLFAETYMKHDAWKWIL